MLIYFPVLDICPVVSTCRSDLGVDCLLPQLSSIRRASCRVFTLWLQKPDAAFKLDRETLVDTQAIGQTNIPHAEERFLKLDHVGMLVHFKLRLGPINLHVSLVYKSDTSLRQDSFYHTPPKKVNSSQKVTHR